MTLNDPNTLLPKPFLKWVGGKRQLLPDLLKRIEKLDGFERYHEPFVGGGALFFELSRRNAFGRKQTYLSDNNPNLVAAYLGLQSNVDRVIKLLQKHAAHHDPANFEAAAEYYYAVRAQQPQDDIAKAARIIYLNKTCYNGLYRENSKGQFNVPMGRYENPVICDEPTLRAASEALQRAKISQAPFDSVVKHAKPGDLVYFDPPYVPMSKTASFTDYAAGGFGPEAQQRLADVYATLSKRGVYVLLSNSMTDTVKNLYKPFRIDPVMASRAVNSRADRRGKIAEALVSNFD